MTQQISPATPVVAGRKLFLFRLITFAAVCGIAAIGAEVVLRWRNTRIATSDRLDAGMVQYDSTLGWKLSPGWSGNHRHHDYTAKYQINELGFRSDTPFRGRLTADPLVMVVGDSFTFGLGVNDTDTFVHHLGSARVANKTWANGSVPGYSTDQQVLLVEQRILGFSPNEIVLVVYVGNDLLDIQYPVPLQVSSPKPYFEPAGNELILRNTPVPLQRQPRPAGVRGLMDAVLGANHRSLRVRLEQRSELFHLLSETLLPAESHVQEFPTRFAPAVRLFGLLLDRLSRQCERQNVKLSVAVLAGRSFFHSPSSISAQYQEYFREQVIACCERSKLPSIDVATLMRQRNGAASAAWFHPNEGHLTAAGHRLVADILAEHLTGRR